MLTSKAILTYSSHIEMCFTFSFSKGERHEVSWRNVELAELEIFRAVAREESMGVSLFLRDSKKMTLTPEGQRLLDYAERLLTLAEEARQSMRTDTPSG